MTREETIWYLSPIAESAALPRYKEALGMAIAALKEQGAKGVEIDPVKNEPLTLEELRTIAESEEYGAHVWVKELADHDIIAAVTDHMPPYGVVALWSYGVHEPEFTEKNYGKTWLAYKNKPEG